MSYGVEVAFKWGKDTNYIVVMCEGKTYIKARSYSGTDNISDPKGGKPIYLGFGCNITLDQFIQGCYDMSKESPQWLADIKLQLSAGVVLNKVLDKVDKKE